MPKRMAVAPEDGNAYADIHRPTERSSNRRCVRPRSRGVCVKSLCRGTRDKFLPVPKEEIGAPDIRLRQIPSMTTVTGCRHGPPADEIIAVIGDAGSRMTNLL